MACSSRYLEQRPEVSYGRLLKIFFIVYNDKPKLENLRREFPGWIKRAANAQE